MVKFAVPDMGMLGGNGGSYFFVVMLIFIACQLSVSSPPVKARVASGAGKRSSHKAEGGERSSSSGGGGESESNSESDVIFKRFEGLQKAPGKSPTSMPLRGSQWHPKEVSAPKSLPSHRTEESESESETASQDSLSRGPSDADEGKDHGGADSSPTQGGELCADDARNLVSGRDGDRLLVSGVPCLRRLVCTDFNSHPLLQHLLFHLQKSMLLSAFTPSLKVCGLPGKKTYNACW